jgi:formiminotetrahydrofolate cyclodeaminase
MERMMNKSLKNFCDAVGSDSFAPGGGCVSALAGALGASLGKMVLTLTVGKKKYAEFDSENRHLLETMSAHQQELMKCVDLDADGCQWIMEAMALPKDSESEKAHRKSAMSDASKKANEAPMKVCELSLEILRHLRVAINKVNRNAISDWACGALQAYAGLEGAAMNVKINCGSIEDTSYCRTARDKLRGLLGEGRKLLDEMMCQVHSSLDASN